MGVNKIVVKGFLALAILVSSNAFGQTPVKRVLVEEATGAWCSSCAFGSVYSTHLEDVYPNAVMVARHYGDPMENLTISQYMGDYYSAYPTFLYDRVDFPSNPKVTAAVSAFPWATALDTLNHYLEKVYNEMPVVTVGIDQTYNPTTREISVSITANFIADVMGEFRLNCFIVEDSVTGNSLYNQSNSNFSGWTGGPSFLQPLIDAPGVIQDYAHGHVLRDMLGNPEGATASIPTSVSAGNSYSKSFTYTLPATYNEDKISLIGVVQRYGPSKINDRQIVNVLSKHLQIENTTGINSVNNNFVDVSIYPNPIKSNSRIEFYIKTAGQTSCDIYNLLGEKVKTIFNDNLKQGEYSIPLNEMNLGKGMYLLRFTQSNNVNSERIIIN